MRGGFLLCTVAASGLASAAYADSANAVVSVPQSTDSAATGATSSAASTSAQAATSQSSQQLTEIVVTAQRRSESLQKVPLAVTAISGAGLIEAGVKEPKDLASVVPGLAISSGNGPADQIYIRGVGTSIANLFGDNAVSFNVDGVVLARATGLENQFYDVARVEVLEGPQGILYGRNSTGGAINVITNKPSFGSYSGDLTVEAGNYNLSDFEADVNIPVSDTFALRAAAREINRDGYFTDGYETDKGFAGRLRGLYQPNDQLSVLLNTDYTKSYNKGPGTVLSPFLDPSNPWLGGSTPTEQSQFRTLAGHLPLSPLADNGYIDAETIGVSADIDYKAFGGVFTVIPAYRNIHDSFIDYNAGFLNDYTDAANQESFEARFASDDSKRLSFVTGIFIFHENRHADQYVNQNVTSSTTLINRYPTDAEAAFGQAKYKVTSRFRVTGGLRYTNESKSLNGQSTSGSGVVTPYLGNETYNNVSWKVGGEYDLNARTLLYANVGTGFKAGGFFSSPAPYNTFKPEEITAYTIGEKSQLFNNRLRLNTEFFYWDYKNHQESHLAISPTGAIVYATQNVGAATMKGFDSEATLALWRLAQASVKFQYLDAVFNSFSFTEASPTGAPITGCAETAGAAKGTYQINCSGEPAIRAPRYSGNIDLQQGMDVPYGGRLTGHVDLDMASGQWEAIDYAPGEYQKGYTKVDFSLEYKPTLDSKWSVTGWVRNIGDVAVKNYAIQQLFAPKIVLVDLAPPTTYGARLNMHF
jgi:iron complex outermembrane receptor protein